MAEVMMDSQPFLEPLGRPLFSQGKVREMWNLGDGRLLMVATDRISTFDVAHPNGIPDKGRVLTALSTFWMQHPAIRQICLNHFEQFVMGGRFPTSEGLRSCMEIAGRALVVREAKRRFDVECIVRAHITGSAWTAYESMAGPRDGATVAGVKYPPDLRQCQELPELLFTPTTKAEEGHDEDITWSQFIELVGSEQKATQLRSKSLELFRVARKIAVAKGIIIADTKFEFGEDGQGTIMLIDEVLTPDSSRFWDAKQFEPGRPQESFDKQYVRDYAASTGWDKKPPAPEIPPNIAATTAAKYREILFRLTGSRLN